MTDLQAFDIVNPNNFNNRNEIFYSFLNKFIKFKKVKKLYAAHSVKAGLEFVDSILDALNLQAEVSEKDLAKIPKKGAFAIVSNLPMGGLEALILAKIILQVRDDFKIVSTARFHEMGPLECLTLPLNEKEKKSKKPCLKCAKRILEYLENGGALAFFPSSGPATFSRNIKLVVDNQWNTKITKIIKIANIPVIPVFFNDSFRRIYHTLGNLHPVIQSFFVQKEMLKKRDSIINFRIGTPIKPVEQEKFKDIWRYTRFLRARVYALGAKSPLDVNKFFKYKKKFKISKVQPIAPAVDSKLIIDEINTAKEDYLLHSQKEFDIICAPVSALPNVLTEIGRLREITFREVGEGTNKSLDIDEYDLYYNHLLIWDRENEKIVGAYRIGRGDEIIEKYSIKGFYINSLFNIKKAMIPVLRESLEMGRSFIVKEYQRKPLSLFLLWKGILYFLLKNPQYRYLIGPVSISQDFSELAKSLIVNFFSTYYYEENLGKYVKPRKKYKVNVEDFDKQIILQDIGNNLNKLDKYIKDIEPNAGIPVLFKKYMTLGAKTIAFNVDPKFNNCLDGLMILDIFNVSEDILKALAKDLDDSEVLNRFKISEIKGLNK